MSAVHRGPAGQVNVRNASGHLLVARRRLGAFTNSEAAAGLTRAAPFLLESGLRELGAHYEKG